ncbi:4-diphosphocytidyl-2C-methyl-D-erythritol kinase [Croceivirga lutea]|uniref:nucleotidyltransferase family protein n=1 Tax=Croceivirga lutea TaxID=1775167 RepID=UPI00163A7CBC|nr:nucleotidyltransferase family protein [Croceivirga lutea]GGG45268.1 4-diphosphocytidyl-2C-methyl-D-erythritol kinase [Croceivirga lutea]
MPKTAILILAAGASTRMGRPKQLLPWKNTTLIGNCIKTAKAITADVLVVLGANATIISDVLPSSVETAINIGWKNGMGTSIAFGVQQIEEKFQPEQLLVLLIDQPLIDEAYLKKLLRQNSNKIVATKYGNRVGVPVLFPRTVFKELKNLSADHGARHLLEKFKDQLLILEANGKAVDLDTPENYANYFDTYGK